MNKAKTNVLCVQRYATASQLGRELRAFTQEHQLTRDLVPSASMLRAADRSDLLSEIQRFGGALSLAPLINMRTQRGSGYSSVAAAVAQLLSFVQECNAGSSLPRDSWRMPSQQQLRQAGRFDLRAAIEKYGQAEMARAANLKPNARGRPKSLHKCNSSLEEASAYSC